MNMSVTSKMPTNCGMSGMHGNSVKKPAEQDTAKINSEVNKQSMSTNCGMKNMNHSSSANSVQATNTSDVNPNLGTAIDVKA